MADEVEDVETHDCGRCHGAGGFVCVDGCHTVDCDECDGYGQLDADDNPTSRTVRL